MDLSFKPRFVKRYARLEEAIIDAVGEYGREVREGVFPTEAHSFKRRTNPKIAKLY